MMKLAVPLLLGALVAGCAVIDTTVGLVGSVVTTTADVAGSVVSGAADVVTSPVRRDE